MKVSLLITFKARNGTRGLLRSDPKISPPFLGTFDSAPCLFPLFIFPSTLLTLFACPRDGGLLTDAHSESEDTARYQPEKMTDLEVERRTVAAIASVQLFSSTTNESAATTICNALASTSPGDIFTIINQASGLRWEMPDCLYEASNVYTLIAPAMILRGNATYPDPLVRLGKGLSHLSALTLSDGLLLTQANASYVAAWGEAFTALPSLVTLSIKSMGLLGLIPQTSVFPSTLTSITLTSNLLSGSIPTTIFNSLPSGITSLTYAAGSNSLTGSLPTSLFGSLTIYPNLTSISITFEKNQLTGNLPSIITPGSAPKLSTFDLGLNGNPFGGTVPTALLSTILNKTYTGTRPTFNIQCSSCQLSGVLELPTSGNTATSSQPFFRLSYPNNSFTAISFGTNVASYFSSLEVSYNTRMTGTLDAFFASAASAIQSLGASFTAITGTMPIITSSQVANSLLGIQLANTSLEFCDPSSRTAWNPSEISSSACILTGTSAYYCPTLWPKCVVSEPLPVTPTEPPIEPPTPVTVPVAVPVEVPVPVDAPVASPMAPTPIACAQASKPTTGTFTCTNGSWTYEGTIDTPTFVIPTATVGVASSTVVIITGNVSSSQIQFDGIGTTLSVTGCVSNLRNVTVTLTESDLDAIGKSTLRQTLVSVTGSGASCTDLSNVTVVTHIAGSTCKRLTTKTQAQSTQLIALFSVSDSGCSGKSNTWWIILVSVICAVVVLGVVALILVFTLNEKAKECCRPYTKSHARRVTRMQSEM